ncbi:MAG: flagellar basal body rod protein FlgC [Phycisphaerae bacterium]|nr:flagellar basal body rod protein FlgC [Phycisphaerae bacterium]
MKIDNQFDPVDIAVSGIKAQAANIKVISTNVANAQTADNGNGQPYRRLEAVFRASDEDLGPVSIEELAADMSTGFPKILKPGHPMADQNGYVSMPNVSMPMEMMNLNAAARSYQANVAILKRYQQVVETSLELLK